MHLPTSDPPPNSGTRGRNPEECGTPPWTEHRRASRVLLAAAVLLGAHGSLAAQSGTRAVAELRREAEQLRRERRLPEALAAYRTLVEREPESFEDRFWVAKLESWTGRPEAAESALVRLLRERPDDYDTRIALADVRAWRGDRPGARAVLESLQRSHPGDPEVRSRLERLGRLPERVRWQTEVEYYGERLAGRPATNGATLALVARPSGRLRWRAAATVQDKFERTESRLGGEISHRLTPRAGITGAVHIAPGAEVLPGQSYALGLDGRVGRLVLQAEYELLDFHDAGVHRFGPGFELYLGRDWLLAGRYRYARTRFDAVGGGVGDHSGLLTVGRLYGEANLLRVFAAAGGESFAAPSRDLIGELRAHAFGAAWRHFLTPRLGLEITYAHQDRSGGGDQDSYSLRVVRRW